MAGLPLFNRRPGWMRGATALTTRWLESTLEVARWENMRRAGRRWGWWGAGVGAMLGLIAYAPAPWLAKAVVSASDGRLLLADAKGTIWRGDAVAVLTGGPGSRDARALPGRLNWSMRLGLQGVSLVLQQDCCIQTPLVLLVQPAWSGATVRVAMQPQPEQPVQNAGEIGHWPAAWLGGLGTPWNTLQLSGVLRVSTRDLSFRGLRDACACRGRPRSRSTTLLRASPPSTAWARTGWTWSATPKGRFNSRWAPSMVPSA